jgi:hypothetical protein
MKPKLTIAVRRGLKTIAALAGSDVDADRSEECPQFAGRALRDIYSALRWIGCLDGQGRPPKVDQDAARKAVAASKCIAGVLPHKTPNVNSQTPPVR